MQTWPDVSAAEKINRYSANWGAGYVCRGYPSRPSRNRRKTRHGSFGRGTLIIHGCPGSMMGKKLSVVSHQGPQHRRALGLTPESWSASRPIWQPLVGHDRLYAAKRTLINGWGNVLLQKYRGHHYLEPGDTAADREREHGVRTQLNFLLITGTACWLKLHDCQYLKHISQHLALLFV